MRLHSLHVTAFGPFAGEEHVDFDALAEGGLFLLHGPTGAGKTSVLDAVCFALYGQVPGARRTTARLRSDHAGPDVAPQVRVEFSVGTRRLEVTRSPAWERPKRRGTGTTTEQARVAVRERVGGGWEPLTTRIDEAAHLLEDLLGLGADQFTQLVLLPQGEFAAFLRADGDERKAVLERLFGTDRYAALATWVRERRAAQRRQVEAAAARTQLLLARAEQAVAPLGDAVPPARPPVPPGGDAGPDAEEALPDDAQVRARLAVLRRAAGAAAEHALAGRAAAQTRLEAGRREYSEAVLLADRRAEHAEHSAVRAALLETAGQAQALRDRLLAAQQAQPVASLVASLDDAAALHAQAVAALDAVTARLGAAPEPQPGSEGRPAADLPDDALRAAVEAVTRRVGELAAVADDAATLVTLDAGAAASRRAAQAARAEHERLTGALAETLAGAETLRARLAEAAALAADRPRAADDERAAAAVLAAVGERDRLTARAAELAAAAAAAETDANRAMRAWLDARRGRLDGIAAELAAELTPGAPCAVCGGCEHPAPAVPAPGSTPVTAAAEQALHTAFETADAAKDAAAAALAAAREGLATATAAAGERTPEQARDVLAAARERLAAATDADREAAALAAQEPVLAARAAALTERLATAQRLREEADAEVSRLHERLAGLRERVDRARGDDPSVAARRNRLQGWADAALAVLDGRRLLAETRRGHERAVAAARRAARAAGFDDVAACVAALLPTDEVTAGLALLRRRDDDLAAATARLADPALAAAAAGPEPQPAAAATRLELLRADDAASARAVALAEEAVRGLDAIAVDLDVHLRSVAPVAERFAVLDALSRCLDGTGGDNGRRMPLSAFVLAARLEQVAEAASVRLAQMSGGRYALVHSDAAEKGRGRAGLGLAVVDEWTGRRRDTGSLSGGEAFYTSLALALGLADVVSAEAGGTTVETLFVDEGFGSLDEDTLEEVMDVLDGLRTGGRVVGLVSHVADLRDRMPARLEVVKTRTGSRLRLALTG